MTKKVRKRFHARVTIFTDGTIRVDPIDDTDWRVVNEEIKEDRKKRVPRAELFLRSLNLQIPGTPVPENLLALAAEKEVYRGPLIEAARNLGLLNVVQVLEWKDE